MYGKYRISMENFLKYRNAWIGCAMIWIVWFHSDLNLPVNALKIIKAVGYGGVDICLFASGIGCYYSLNRDSDIYSFMRRRAIRLIPTYWLFLIVWIGWKLISTGISWREIIGNFFFIQSFTGLGNDFNWYISALLLFYIMVPFLKAVIDKTSFFSTYILFILLCV